MKSIIQTDKETWKDIKGYEEYYQISNFGNVRSKNRWVINHQNGTTRHVKGENLTPWDNGNGYLVITLNKERKRKNYYIHRLVAEHFLDNPERKTQVNHLDYDKHNNKSSNLEWCTQKENVFHSLENMKKPKSKCIPSSTGEKYITKKLVSGKQLYYRVQIKRLGVEKTFKLLSEAISYRNEVVEKWQNQ